MRRIGGKFQADLNTLLPHILLTKAVPMTGDQNSAKSHIFFYRKAFWIQSSILKLSL